MSDNQISLLKLNFKTNVKGYTKHVPYNVRYSDKTIPVKLVENNINLPRNCLFFSDLISFQKKDYNKNYGTFLKSLVSITQFSKTFKEKLNKEYKNKKINRKQAFTDKVHEGNLLLLIKLIFKPGSPFYLVKDKNPLTVIKCKEAIKPVNVGKVINWKGNKFRLYEYNVFLKLSAKTPGETKKSDLKKSNCEDIKYNIDAISYKLLSKHVPNDQLKDYYDKKYDKHLNEGEKLIEIEPTPKMYTKKGGKTRRKQTRKKKQNKKRTRKNYKLKDYDMYRMYY